MNYNGEPRTDVFSSNGIDRMGDMYSNGPGTWSGGPTPSPVPLPAPLRLFATGLAALGRLGWRRKRRAALAA